MPRPPFVSSECSHCKRIYKRRLWEVSATSKPLCVVCLEMNLEKSETTISGLNSILEKKETIKSKLNSRLQFLEFQVDNEKIFGLFEGDLKFIVQGRTDEPVHAHKLVLASKSPVFQAMLDAPMLERETGIIRIDDATLPVVRALVKFCYTAIADFKDEDATPEEMFEVSHKYAIPYLQEICEEHLATTINARNLYKRLKLTKKISATRIQAAASDYLKINFDKFISAVPEKS